MRSLELWTVIAATIFGLSLNVLATEPADRLDSGGQQANQKDSFVAKQDASNSELLAVELELSNTVTLKHKL